MPQNIKEAMDRFLSQYLPLLYQQQSRQEYTDYNMRAYLERYLKQLAASEESTKRIDEQRLQDYYVRQLIESLAGETKDLPYSSGQMIERAGPITRKFGLETPPRDPALTEKTQRFAQIGRELAQAKVTGAEPSDELIEEAISLFGLGAVREEVGKYNEAALKRIDQVAREREIDIKRIGAETGRLTAITGAGKAAREPLEEQRKGWLDFVTDIEDHLRQEGIALPKDKASLQDMMRVFSASGKFPDPLSDETRGKVFSVLGGIRTRLIDGTLPTAGEKKFLAEARNTYKIESIPPEEGGGLIDPTKTKEEIEIEEATIRAYMDVVREFTGKTDEAELRRLAIEFLRLKK